MKIYFFFFALSYMGFALSFSIRSSQSKAISSSFFTRTVISARISSLYSSAKGFGTPKKQESEVKKEEEKDVGTQTYEKQAKRGVPEYNIFMRPINGTESEWVPVGSMTIPRDTAPSRAIYEVEKELLTGSFKLYPKLKAFYEVRADKSTVFEYGYCLKAFPDEEIKIAKKSDVNSEEDKGFFGNWLQKITNPLDTGDLKNKGTLTLKQ
jgi:hypothetical protein